jgi:hypothetical protein
MVALIAIPQPYSGGAITMPSTEKQLAANRRKSLRSTGPRTEDGKRAVRLNALMHGILVREIITNAEAILPSEIVFFSKRSHLPR